MLEAILHTSLRMATPIVLAALGGLFTHKANVLNIALEGMMLMGAFAGVLASFATGNIFIAIIAAIFASMLFALLFNVFGITLKGNFIITGLAVNIFAAGLTSFILQVAFGRRGVFSDPKIVGTTPVHIDFLDKIPFIGPIINDHSPMVYVSILIAIAVYFVLNHTKYGIYVRAVGENEEAAKAIGIKVNRIKYSTVYISAILCALAGVNLSLGNLTMFVENMTNGRGFIALAAIFCGRGTTLGTYVFSFLFGFADSIQLRLQNLNIPGTFVQMIPFIFIVVVLSIVGAIRMIGNLDRGIKDE